MIRAGVLQYLEGRTGWSSLFVFGSALLLLSASLLPGTGYRWAAIALMGAGLIGAPGRALPRNAISVAVGMFSLWLLADAAFFTPNYTVDGVYRPVALLGGYVVVAALGRGAQIALFRAGVGLLAALVLLGLLQFYLDFWHLSHNPTRAAATFITPNTFATAINLFLAPLIALAVVRRGGWHTYALALGLFAGLLATESRGGYLGFLAGCAFIAAYSGIPRSREGWRPWFRLLGGLLAVLLVFSITVFLRLSGESAGQAFGTTIISRGSSMRLELGTVALGLILERPVAGFGANMFYPLYEMRKPVELDDGSSFLYVHNDYLQIWLEFGLPGIVLLLAVIASACVLLYRARRAGDADPVPLACGAALASCFAHALVDFPLYVPFLLMVTGSYLGALAAFSGDGRVVGPALVFASERLAPLRAARARTWIAIAALAWLALPVAAELTGRKAMSALFAARADEALYWQWLTRQFEPRNAFHAWAEGVVWRDQGIAAKRREFAARADEMFARASSISPYEINYLIERARMHRRHGELFEHPAPAAAILAWTGRAVELRPYSVPAGVEHARALAYAGQITEAQRLARALLDRHPGREAVLRLVSDLQSLTAPATKD